MFSKYFAVQTTHIVQSFLNLSIRLNLLIQQYITRIHLPPGDVDRRFVLQSSVQTIKLDDNELEHLFSYSALNGIRLVYPCLKSIILTNIPPRDAKYIEYFSWFRPFLLLLKMNFLITGGNAFNHHLLNRIFENNDDCKIETVSVKYSILSIQELEHEHPCSSIKSSTLNVKSYYHLLSLFEYLPALELCDVRISNDVDDSKGRSTITEVRLKQFFCTILSCFHNYDHLEELIVRNFSSSLEHLPIYLKTSYIINGEILESKLIRNLLNLQQFQFYITCLTNENDIDMLIRTHQSDYWLQNYPDGIMFYYLLDTNYCASFSLPYAFDHFEYISNNICNYRLTR